MNFADKYQILNQIPAGKVDTYVAKDLETGERVLLHVFETQGKTQSPVDQLGAGSAARSEEDSCSPGAAPPSGQQPPRRYTYSVTDSSSLQTWKNLTDHPGRDRVPEERAPVDFPSQPARSEEPPPLEPSATSIHTAVLSSSASQPGEFTRQFFALPEQELQSSESRPERRFQAVSERGVVASTPQQQPLGSMPEQDETQGFTSFFQGPFHGDRQTDTPTLASNVSAKPFEKSPGEFTRVFGSEITAGASTHTEPEVPRSKGEDAAIFGPGLEMPPGLSLNGGSRIPLFRDFQPAGPANSDSPLTETRIGPEISTRSYARNPLQDGGDSEPSPRNDRNLQSFEAEFDQGKRVSLATDIFAAPRPDPPPSPLPAVTGPSEYTQIIYRDSITKEVEPVDEDKLDAPNAGSGKAPEVPKIPGLKAPGPKIPEPRALKAPPVATGKKLAAVKLPTKQRKLTALPMIVVSSAFLLISLAMALYFMLKH